MIGCVCVEKDLQSVGSFVVVKQGFRDHKAAFRGIYAIFKVKNILI